MSFYIRVALVTFLAFVSYPLILAAPHSVRDNSVQLENTYAGPGGHSSGGNINTSGASTEKGLLGESLLKLFSGNAGTGGHADSVAYSSKHTSAELSSGDCSGCDSSSTANSVGDIYSGVGGTADGGSVNNANDAILELFSDNAGNGGKANSEAGTPLGIMRKKLPAKARSKASGSIRAKLT